MRRGLAFSDAILSASVGCLASIVLHLLSWQRLQTNWRLLASCDEVRTQTNRPDVVEGSAVACYASCVEDAATHAALPPVSLCYNL